MNSYLKKSIIAFVPAMAAGNAVPANAYDTTIFDSVEVVGTPPPSDPAGSSDDGSSSSGNDGDSGTGGGGGEPEPSVCDALRASKPENCPNAIPYSTGSTYALDRLPGGSGIPKVLYFADHVNGVAPQARATIHAALERHTNEIAGRFTPASTLNSTLLNSVSQACKMQRDHDQAMRNSLGLKLTYQEKKCLESLERLTAEDSGEGFSSWFLSWMSGNQLALTDLGIPETVINLFDPANSLQKKYELATLEAKCASWWQQAQAAQCST